jgi:hypothetical protein
MIACMHDDSLDLGAQVAYLVLAVDTPVYCTNRQEVGRVEEVLSVGNDEIFDGLMVKDGFHKHYVVADSIEAIYERGVMLALTEEDFKQLGSRVES